LGAASILGISNFGSFWTLLIGLFLLQNAGISAQTATVQEKLSGLTAADAVIPNSPMISADKSLRDLANNYIIGNENKWRKFLVTDDTGHLIGEIAVDDLKTIPTNDWWDVQVTTLTKPLDQITTVPANQPLLEVVTLLEDQKLPAVAVVAEDNILVGLLEKASIIQLLQKQAEVNAEAA
jgi:CBS-domain-containing membrane protein